MQIAKYLLAGVGGATLAATFVLAVTHKPTAASETEQAILGVLDEMWENERAGMWNIQPSDGRLLRLLTEATNAQNVVEIGTSNGYSAIWLCLGLRATGGKLTTFEIDTRRAGLARRNFKRAGVESIVTLVEGNAHQEIARLKEPIDLLFLDADKSGYINYLNKLLPLVRPGGLILAHNTKDYGTAMRDYIEAVTTHPDLETIFLDEDDIGMGVTLKKRQPGK